ncbi:unnamed protein product [Oreochromis niloticus]|nr:unnamed protein product [Mustela putorius furo]
MEQEGCDTEAVEQQEAFEEQESLQEPCTSKATKEGSLRKSQRVKKFTERGQALHDEKVNKLQACFKVSYERWKVVAKQGKKALEEPVSAKLKELIARVEYASAEVKQVYDELCNHESPDADTRRRVDTCDAVSQKMIRLVQEKLAAEEDEELSERLVHWSDIGSAFNSATSQRSKSSNSRQSRCSSKLSVKRQEAAAELAATEPTLKIMVEMESERKALEILEAENAEKQKALEQKRRELERLETVKRMNAAKARLKVYNEEEISDLLHERSKRRNATSKPMNQFAHSQLNANAEPFDMPQATSRSQPRESKQEDGTTTLAQALAESIHISRLPVPEPTVFNGDPLKYKDWKLSFQMLIDRKNIPVNEKIYYLHKYVGGPARKAVESYFLLGTERAYYSAWNILEERYGSSFVITKAFRDKLTSWPRIGNKDSVELREFSDFLRGCEAAMLQVKGLEVLNDCNENQRMLSKLPDWLSARWNRKVIEIEEQDGSFPTFSHFVDFIAREAKIACNPVTSLHALKAGDSEKMKSSRTRIVGAKVLVRGFYSSRRIPLPVTYTREFIPANLSHIPTPRRARAWPHLEHLLTNSLVGVLCRFRKGPVAVMCDIERMFHQFRVREEDQDYFRFLWWDNGDFNSTPSVYRMRVHLFGAASSPACANFGLKYIAAQGQGKFSEATIRFTERNFYVDNGLISFHSEEEAIRLVKEAKELCSTGGLPLHKFVSNSKQVLNSLPEEDCAETVRKDLSLSEQQIERALGVKWCIDSDHFQFRVVANEQPLSRRGVLSTVASIYDPLGFVAPFVLLGKQILQQMCREKADWDEPLTSNLKSRWESWLLDLKNLADVKIDRCYVPRDFQTVQKYKLHHFSDTSVSGYGVCTYLRAVSEAGQVHCSLVFAKSRVAPTKVTTVPRLELSAAVVAVRISDMLKAELELEDAQEFFWTDSQVVLGYINNDARRFHVFVANRIQRIKESTQPMQWKFVASDLNPADHASRGLKAKDLITSNWFSGPSFLCQEKLPHGEVKVGKPDAEDPEVRKAGVLHTTTETDSLAERFLKFSSWSRLVKAMARLLRFVKAFKGLERRSNKATNLEERKEAKLKIISILHMSENRITNYQSLTPGGCVAEWGKTVRHMNRLVVYLGLLFKTMLPPHRHPAALFPQLLGVCRGTASRAYAIFGCTSYRGLASYG